MNNGFHHLDFSGLPLDVATFESGVGRLKTAMDNRERGYVCLANVHMVTTARRDEEFAAVLRGAKFVLTDGMPLVWLAKRAGQTDAERLPGTDVTIALCGAAAELGISVYFYGGSPLVTRRLESALRQKFPELKATFEAPPMLPERPAFSEETAARITNSGAGLVFVGLGCPKQEFWMRAHAPAIPALLLGVGAAFDFLSGSIKRAPPIMQRAGLEWLHRLSTNPRRLAGRYLTTNIQFAIDVARYRVM